MNVDLHGFISLGCIQRVFETVIPAIRNNNSLTLACCIDFSTIVWRDQQRGENLMGCVPSVISPRLIFHIQTINSILIRYAGELLQNTECSVMQQKLSPARNGQKMHVSRVHMFYIFTYGQPLGESRRSRARSVFP